jgi:transcriptional regulator CtsR
MSAAKIEKTHYPQLNTILMIENAIKRHNGEYTVTQLWKKLEKKVMYQTYKTAIDYLLDSRKIAIKNKKLIWIFNPELMDRLMAESEEA